jgi:translation initiation factor RLI1
MSVENNIMSILEMTMLNKKEQKEKLEELLTDFNLLHIRKNLGIQLSGGERRRTEIAWFGLELDLFLVPFPLMFPKENKLLFFYRHHYGILYIFKSEANKQRFLCFGLLFY